MLVFTCSDGSQTVADLGGGQYAPACSTGGAWVEVQVQAGPEPFDVATWLQQHPEQFGEPLAAGFTFVAASLLVFSCVGLLLDFIRR